MDDKTRTGQWPVPTERYKFGKVKPNSLATIIGSYKSIVKKYCNQNGFKSFAWQPRFRDRILRNEKELTGAQEYIDYNPDKWRWDRENLAGLYM